MILALTNFETVELQLKRDSCIYQIWVTFISPKFVWHFFLFRSVFIAIFAWQNLIWSSIYCIQQEWLRKRKRSFSMWIVCYPQLFTFLLTFIKEMTLEQQNSVASQLNLIKYRTFSDTISTTKLIKWVCQDYLSLNAFDLETRIYKPKAESARFYKRSNLNLFLSTLTISFAS